MESMDEKGSTQAGLPREIYQCIYNDIRGYLRPSMHTRILKDLEINVEH